MISGYYIYFYPELREIFIKQYPKFIMKEIKEIILMQKLEYTLCRIIEY